MSNHEQNQMDLAKEIKQRIKDIVNQSDDADIRELCGVVVLVGTEIEVRTITNIAEPMSQSDYKMSPKELGEKTKDTDLFRSEAENTFLGFWHTHPHSDSMPSQVDIRNCMLNKDYYIYSVRDESLHKFIVEGAY